MNAAPPVFHAPPSSDAVQPDAPASAATRAGSQDFAAALNDAGAKPVRKSAANKQQGPAASGGSLPAPGNPPPPAVVPPPPVTTEALAAVAATAAAAAADAAAKVNGAQGSAQGSQPDAIAAGSTAPANAGGATGNLTLPNLDPGPPQAPEALSGLQNSATGDDATAPSSVGPTAAGSGMTMPHAASIRTLAAANARTAASSDATAKQGTAASDSGPSSTDANALNDSTLSNGSASGTGTDAVAQAVMAAAIAQGNAAVPDSTSSDDLSTPYGGLPSGAAAVSGAAAGTAAAGAPAAALAQASAAAVSAATTAATAASIAQAVLAAAGTGAADRRSRSNSPDSTPSGVSNDGSAGAAQLLTSNTSTDSAPAPTFKVAAGVDTAQFGQGVADRVSMMMDGNLTSAKLQVNPPALGPIEVRIALQGGHAQVSFSSHSAVTRDALESSSTKLKEMLGSQGFSSVSVDISQRSFQERSPQSQAYERAPSISGSAPVLAQAPVSMSRSASGLLDAYA